MKKTNNFLLKIFLLLITFILPFFISQIDVSAKVIDYAEVLTNEDSLNKQTNKFNEFGIGLDVISITSLNGKNIDKYTDELYHSLYGNTPDKALIVFSPKDRKIRVHTGSNAKKLLTDNIADEMINEVKNDFRNKNYSAGIEKAIKVGYEKINIKQNPPIKEDESDSESVLEETPVDGLLISGEETYSTINSIAEEFFLNNIGIFIGFPFVILIATLLFKMLIYLLDEDSSFYSKRRSYKPDDESYLNLDKDDNSSSINTTAIYDDYNNSDDDDDDDDDDFHNNTGHHGYHGYTGYTGYTGYGSDYYGGYDSGCDCGGSSGSW